MAIRDDLQDKLSEVRKEQARLRGVGKTLEGAIRYLDEHRTNYSAEARTAKDADVWAAIRDAIRNGK